MGVTMGEPRSESSPMGRARVTDHLLGLLHGPAAAGRLAARARGFSAMALT